MWLAMCDISHSCGLKGGGGLCGGCVLVKDKAAVHHSTSDYLGVITAMHCAPVVPEHDVTTPPSMA